MARSNDEPKLVKLTYKSTGEDTATVQCSEEQAEALLTSGLFTKAGGSSRSSGDTKS